MVKVAFLFPGQGSQEVGMGKDLYEHSPAARQVLDQLGQWTHPELKSVMFEGPEDRLKQTLFTQPAIFGVSVAALTAFREVYPEAPSFAAGHSVGEYAALYAAGVFDLETGAKLVQKRADLMENAPSGAMAAILGMAEADVEKAVAQVNSERNGVLTVANYNTNEQYVVSGDPESIEAVCVVAKALGAKRALRLPVGGAFHSPLMAKAAEEFAGFAQGLPFNDAQFPVVTNIDAKLTTKGPEFQAKLATQIKDSVRWTDSIRLMGQQGVSTYVEIGPGKVLAGMIKRIDKEANVYNVYDSKSLQETLEAMKERALV